MGHIFEAITAPFVAFSILLDESRRNNEDGSWNDYWARKNCNAELRELRRKYRAEKKAIKAKWTVTTTTR